MAHELDKTPNKYTINMGILIRKAREDAGLTQSELGKKIFRKRLAVSEMENGKVQINAWVLQNLSIALKKPITYFFPKIWTPFDPNFGDLDANEKELINNFQLIEYEELKRIAVEIIKSIASYNTHRHINEAFDEVLEGKLEKKEYINESTAKTRTLTTKHKYSTYKKGHSRLNGID